MIIVVCGPTGVGKTKLSVELAKKYNGVIVNADATQIYKKLDIGSAKVREDEKEGVKHLLFDIKNPDEDYSVSDYQKDARNTLNKLKNDNIILVGGTGLYIMALLYDYDFSKVNNVELSAYSNEELYNMVKKLDKDTKIHQNNRIRLENFLKREEKVLKKPILLYKNVYFIGLTTERSNLYEIINKRVDKMINKGLLEEVTNLYKEYPNSKVLKRAIGYKELIKYINNELSLSDAIDEIKKNSRHYAKRQYTWFNNKMDIKWFNTDYNNFTNTVNEVTNYIDNNS